MIFKPTRNYIGFYQKLAPVLAFFCVIAVVFTLLVFNYRLHTKVQEGNLRRAQNVLNGQAKRFELLLGEINYLVQSVADGNEAYAFFQSRALGMTMAYGLRASLNNVTRIFERTLAARSHGSGASFSQMDLLDQDGQVLTRWPEESNNQHRPSFMLQESGMPYSSLDGFLCVTRPVVLDGQIQGYIQAYIPYRSISDFLFAEQRGIYILVHDGEVVFPADLQMQLKGRGYSDLVEGHEDPAEKLRTLKLAQLGADKVFPHQLGRGRTLFSSPLVGFPFVIHLVENTDEIINRPGQFMTLLSLLLLSFGGVLGSALILQARTRYLVLSASLLEAEKGRQALDEKNTEMQLLINSAKLGTWIWYPQTGHIEINEHWAEMLGYRLDEIIPTVESWRNRVHPEDFLGVEKGLNAHLRGETSIYQAIHRLKHKSGEWVWVHDTGQVLERDGSGEALRVMGIHLDVTGQKKTERLLDEAKREAEAIIDQFLDSLVVVNNALKISKVNKATCALLGYDEKDLIGQPISCLFKDPTDNVNAAFGFPFDLTREGARELRNVELTYLSRQKDSFPMSFNLSLLENEKGSILGVVAGAKDIKALKRALAFAEEKAAFIENVLDIVPGGLLVLAGGSQIVQKNKTFDRLVTKWAQGLNAAEPWIIEKVLGDLSGRLRDSCVGALTLGNSEDQHFVVEYHSAPAPAVNDVELVVYLQDITEKHRSEEVRNLQATALHQSGESIIITDTRGVIQYVNPAAERDMGYTRTELVGKDAAILNAGGQKTEFYEELWDTVRSGKIWEGRFSNRTKDGSLQVFESCISPVRAEKRFLDRSSDQTSNDVSGSVENRAPITHFVATYRNVTNVLRMQRQLLQAQKLEAVGRLASGIAHEINTPMQYVQNNIVFVQQALLDVINLLRELEHNLVPEAVELDCLESLRAFRCRLAEADLGFLAAEVPAGLSDALEGIERVARIVSAMKEFSHPGTTEKVATDVQHVIENVATISRNEWKHIASLTVDVPPDLPLVPCRPDSLNQVLLNLIINSAHAIEKKNGGKSGEMGEIRIKVALLDGACEIQVSDTGCGIPPEVFDHIFEPLFTTKEVGKGTGQGLAIVNDIVVNKHGGTIQVESRLDHGATFIVRIPFEGSSSVHSLGDGAAHLAADHGSVLQLSEDISGE